MSNVYRRGAVYWWRRSTRLDGASSRAIMLRLSLKTSVKAEAKRRAAVLELELDMVAITIPKRLERPDAVKLQALFKEALEYKRDQIVAIQSRPPFNDERHRLANRAYAKLFSLLTHSGSAEKSGQWEAVLTDPDLDAEEGELLARLAVHHDLISRSDDGWARLRALLKSSGATLDADHITAPVGRPAIAPRFVTNMMENAGIEDSPENRRTALAVVAAAYRAACVEANEALGEEDAEGRGGELPKSLLALLGGAPAPSPALPSEVPEGRKEASPSGVTTTSTSSGHSPAPAEPKELIDLRISDLCKLVIDENKRAGDWGDSARRNAKVITDIFIAENGDLRMSEIERRHLLAIDKRLKVMPTVWGKSREDRQGGMKAVFARGEKLAEGWGKDHVAAERSGLPKVGLSAATYNRHINTLKQLFDFAGNLEDADGEPTHLAPKVSFHKLRQKDKRKKNKRKPVPAEQELHALLSGPIFTGGKSLEDRFTSGRVVVHDGAYWVPVLITIYGPRSNEFCQMPLDNIVDSAPIPYIRIRKSLGQDIKTLATDRDLPIAPRLIELGFIDYVRALRARDEYWLFPEFNTTKVPARKRFREEVFVPLLKAHFPNGTSSILDGKDIDTQSLRKFAMTYLRKGDRNIQLGIRQAFFGHERPTTTEGTYEDDPTVDELFPCVERMQTLIDHLQRFPLRLRFE